MLSRNGWGVNTTVLYQEHTPEEIEARDKLAKEFLRKAIPMVKKDWYQSDHFGHTEHRNGRYCPVTAMSDIRWQASQDHIDALQTYDDKFLNLSYRAADRALTLLQEVIGNNVGIPDWNDQQETVEPVIEALEKAAK